MRGANRLDGERREAEDEREHRARGAAASGGRARPAREHRERDGGPGEQARHVVRVAEPEQVGDEHEEAIGRAPVGIVAPAHHEPRDDREDRERDGVDLLVHDALVPDRERRRADERGDGRAERCAATAR